MSCCQRSLNMDVTVAVVQIAPYFFLCLKS
jgi:hypothetical protein